MRYAFTLIELLVVITIIVVLLALLTPALDKAIYEAEILQCAANEHAIVITMQTYTFDHKRRYIHRPGIQTAYKPSYLYYPPVAPQGANTAGQTLDDRPALIQYGADVNSLFNDPLTEEVNYVDTQVNSIVETPYSLWAGFGYFKERGMFKMGDRFSFNINSDPPVLHRFNLLISDHEAIVSAINQLHGSHPDADGEVASHAVQDSSDIAPGVNQVVLSNWKRDGAPIQRGLIDMNFGFDDGSVQRIREITVEDPRLVPVPEFADPNNYPATRQFIPDADSGR